MANAEEIPPGEQTVVVAGASGKTGTQVVRALLSRGYNVVAGVRNPSRYVDPQPSTPTDAQVAEPPALGLQDVVLQEQRDGGRRLRVERLDVTSGVAELASLLGKTNASFVVCATGFRPSAQTLLGIQDTPKLVDNIGTSNLVDACLANRDRVKGFVLVSSLLTNAPAVGEASNPNYLFLNLLGGVLDEKKAGEDYLRKSGLPWVIVRPGGLSDEPAASLGGLIVRPEDTLFGRETDPGRVISREVRIHTHNSCQFVCQFVLHRTLHLRPIIELIFMFFLVFPLSQQVGIVCADAVAALGGALEGNDDVAFANRVVEVVQAR